ncbi:MAG: hypothetical protein KGI26_07295 [Thaumarchaeota archaeon]|nr:hypothetical protein [Nitrososphaerota archaeon]
MSKRLPRFHRRKGLSEMVGALFILILLAVAFGFALVMFNSFTGYQDAVNTRAQFNAQLPREDLSYNKVVFGASSAYNPNSGFLGTFASTSPASFYPVSNMNFSSDSSGWVFTRLYLQTGVYGMSGNFDPITSEGSASGPGSIFTDFTFNQGSSTTVEAIGNWTNEFTLSAGEVSALSSGTSTISFRIGDNLPQNYNIQGRSGSPVVTVYLQDANTKTTITIGTPTPAATGVWSIFSFTPAIATQHTFFTGSSGVYNLILETDITVKGQSSSAAEQRVYFDDTGVKLLLTNFYSATLCPTFTVSQNPLSVQDLTVDVSTSYTQPVTQTIYLWDYAQSALTQVDVSSVGSSTTSRFVDLGGLVGGASEIQRFIQTSGAAASVSPPGCPNDPITAPQGMVVMKIYAVATASFTGTHSADVLTAFYTSTSQFSVQLSNSGTLAIHIVGFWITGSSGATQYASTLPSPKNFSVWVAPGTTLSFTVVYSWSPGQYTLELISARGNIFSDSVTAS